MLYKIAVRLSTSRICFVLLWEILSESVEKDDISGLIFANNK